MDTVLYFVCEHAPISSEGTGVENLGKYCINTSNLKVKLQLDPVVTPMNTFLKLRRKKQMIVRFVTLVLFLYHSDVDRRFVQFIV